MDIGGEAFDKQRLIKISSIKMFDIVAFIIESLQILLTHKGFENFTAEEILHNQVLNYRFQKPFILTFSPNQFLCVGGWQQNRHHKISL